MGIFFSFLALAAWGVGDFLIQRSVRRFDNWVALFYITAFSSVALLPFVYQDIAPALTAENSLLVLFLASVFITVAAVFNFEALRVGKLSVLEPVFAFEVVITAVLAAAVINERLTGEQALLVAAILIGVFLVSTKSFRRFKSVTWEKGLLYGITGTVAMGASNFLFGLGSRDTSPLMINWFTSVFVMVVSFCYLLLRSQVNLIESYWKNSKKLILGVSIIDNAAWVFYCYGALYAPIAIVTAITESYVALAALLGLIYNKERLMIHQIVGLVITVIAAVGLAAIT